MSASRYTLVLLDPDDDTVATPLGDMAIDGGQIALLSSEPGLLGFLNTILAEIDAHDGVVLRVSGEQQTSLMAKHIPRSDPGFFDGLRTWLGRRYGVELRSPDDLRPELLEA